MDNTRDVWPSLVATRGVCYHINTLRDVLGVKDSKRGVGGVECVVLPRGSNRYSGVKHSKWGVGGVLVCVCVAA